MSIEANKELIRRQYEEITNGKNLAMVETYFTPDFLDHEAPAGQPDGPAAFREYLTGIFNALPDFHVTIEETIAEGDKVVVRNVWRGTHLGEYNGLRATARMITLRGIVIFRIVDGKIAERWATLDELALMQQLGIAGPGILSQPVESES